jgi:hypothetical protein
MKDLIQIIGALLITLTVASVYEPLQLIQLGNVLTVAGISIAAVTAWSLFTQYMLRGEFQRPTPESIGNWIRIAVVFTFAFFSTLLIFSLMLNPTSPQWVIAIQATIGGVLFGYVNFHATEKISAYLSGGFYLFKAPAPRPSSLDIALADLQAQIEASKPIYDQIIATTLGQTEQDVMSIFQPYFTAMDLMLDADKDFYQEMSRQKEEFFAAAEDSPPYK